MIHARMSEIGLPENLWMGVAAVNDKAPEADVKVLFKMHDMRPIWASRSTEPARATRA